MAQCDRMEWWGIAFVTYGSVTIPHMAEEKFSDSDLFQSALWRQLFVVGIFGFCPFIWRRTSFKCVVYDRIRPFLETVVLKLWVEPFFNAFYLAPQTTSLCLHVPHGRLCIYITRESIRCLYDVLAKVWGLSSFINSYQSKDENERYILQYWAMVQMWSYVTWWFGCIIRTCPQRNLPFPFYFSHPNDDYCCSPMDSSIFWLWGVTCFYNVALLFKWVVMTT